MDEKRVADTSAGIAYGRFAGVIEQLNRPLSDAEMADGWSTAAKLGFASALIDIARADLPRTHPNRIHLARAMDHWSISSGALADEILSANAQAYPRWSYSGIEDLLHTPSFRDSAVASSRLRREFADVCH